MLGNDIGVCKAITANGIWNFHLVDRIVCSGVILTDFVPTVGEVSLAEALAFMKAAGGASVNVIVVSMDWFQMAGLQNLLPNYFKTDGNRSIDNFNHRPNEVQYVMDLLQEKIEGLLKEESMVNSYRIMVYVLGNLKLLNEPVRLAAEKAMAATAKNDKAVLMIYQELPIKLADLEKHMYMVVAPDPNILVRTSAELRRTKWVHCSAISGGSAPEVEIGTALLNTSSKYGARDASILAVRRLFGGRGGVVALGTPIWVGSDVCLLCVWIVAVPVSRWTGRAYSSEAGGGMGVVPGVQLHQGTPLTPVIPGQPGILPVPAGSGISTEIKQSIEKTLDVMKFSDNQRVILAAYLLQGEADFWWDMVKRMVLEPPILWSSFQELFFTQYFPQSYRDACILEFYALEQGDMSIARYDQRFNKLARYVPFIVQDKEQMKMKFLKEDRKSRDARNPARQDTRPDKGKAIQTQYDSLGSKRQRFDSTPARAMGEQYLEMAQLSSRTCWNCGGIRHARKLYPKPDRGQQPLRQFQGPVGYQPRPQWLEVAEAEVMLEPMGISEDVFARAEPIISDAGVSVGIVPGVQLHQGTLLTLVIPGQPGILPVPAASGISEEMRQFMESFVASFQLARSPIHREHSYLEQLQRYKHPTFSSTLIPLEAETWLRSID
ncbi:hypothetical protein GIB67_007878 [Kingdonia uniflora]|uniref:Retrotransposon gag domain-containing protein n=1 Tax=Kingdonia uniflora TaxID=39325 RepID=A0A7J7PAL2_9MAGN|nr:hypothetical protein GIB67_007878 [Kingdonia uniflora]